MKKVVFLPFLLVPQLVFACGDESSDLVTILFSSIAVGICIYVLKKVWSGKVARIFALVQLFFVLTTVLPILHIKYNHTILELFSGIYSLSWLTLLVAFVCLIYGLFRYAEDVRQTRKEKNELSHKTPLQLASLETTHILYIAFSGIAAIIIWGLVGYNQSTLCLSGTINVIAPPSFVVPTN